MNDGTRVDFSREATRKAVLSKSLQHPLSVYPVVGGALGLLALLLFDLSFFVSFLAYGSLVFGGGSLFVNSILRKDRIANEYIREVHARIAEESCRKIESLREEFSRYISVRECEEYSRQAEEQFKRIKGKFEHVKEMLGRKFSQTELTYGRYLAAAEQVYLSVLDNLQEIANLLSSAAGIDPDYIERRFAALGKLKRMEKADEEEKETLLRRQELRNLHLTNINSMLTLNERAITDLDGIVAALVTVKTGHGEALVDTETAIRELGELAKRAQTYSID